MKFTNLSKVVGAGVLALSAAVVPYMPASAQTDTGINTPTEGVITEDVSENDGFDWGWLGLIGLFGLAGLAGKKRTAPTAYREPDTVGTTTYRD